MKLKLGWPRRRPSYKRLRRRRLNAGLRRWLVAQGFFWSVVVTLAWGAAAPGVAADRVTIRVGPFEQSFDLSDLERFAETGKLSKELKPYKFFLTSDVKDIMNATVNIDPEESEELIDRLLESGAGNQLIDGLLAAIPGQSVDQVKFAINLAARYGNGLSFLNILRALPDEEITIDATELGKLLLNFNLPAFENQSLTPWLEQELTTVSTASLKTGFDPADPGPAQVQRQTLKLRDGARDRTIPVDLYRSPSSQGPMVVISHGFGADRTFLSYLARHLASHNIPVAALEHPGSNVDSLTNAIFSSNPSSLMPANEFLDRPRDVSFVLDRLAQGNWQPGQNQPGISTDKVTVIGHSLGGYTALALAGGKLDVSNLRKFCQRPNVLSISPANWLQCAATTLPRKTPTLRDPRVVQTIALNPTTGQLFSPESLRQIQTPVLMLSSTKDTLAPALQHQLQPFAQLTAPKYLLTAIGGTHLSAADPDNLNTALLNSLLTQERYGKEVDRLRHLLKGTSLAFVKQLTPEATAYRPFLTAAYAQSLSVEQLPLKLNTDLPENVSSWLGLVSQL